MTNVLFVCTGNTCRSPMAEALFRKMKAEGMDVRSAGVFAVSGQEASHFAKEVLKEKGIELDHQSSMLTNELIDWSDCVLTMTSEHKRLVLQWFPTIHQKLYTLSEFISSEEESIEDVRDPFGGDLKTYQNTRDDLEKLLEKLIKILEDKPK
ncbi:low molecular weight protein arginine phosphatase [Bacillus carboniphilus]|uniref:Low molecular weight protein arginine phosphatase n=1 Tax=Bacillus carboniphilus TaxID=86663 RepID=A0ABY9JQH8_9BACI|nr:low molecular weight protein arginine phosphatase [Bacillus carboniphilus]WLR41661.1 low molecular weight protein arginine phosphatase [Bacillus carboniphilus]